MQVWIHQGGNPIYEAAAWHRGANAVNLVFDRYPDQAQNYEPNQQVITRFIEENNLDAYPDNVYLELQRMAGTWRLDAQSRAASCDPGETFTAGGMVLGALGLQHGPGELFGADTGGSKGGGGGVGFTQSLKSQLKKVQLPTSGRIRFVPPKNATTLRRGPQNGYIDKFGNEWVKGPSRTAGQDFEWDVQLSTEGKTQLGWLSRDGSHVNISLDGRVTHK